MEIEYQQTAADFYTANKHVYSRLYASTRWRFVLLIAGIVMGFTFVWGTLSIGDFYEKYEVLGLENLTSGLIAITIGAISFTAGVLIYNAKVRPLIFEEGGLFLSPIKFIIREEHLLHTMGDNEHYYQWKYVKEVEKTKECIYIFIDRAAALYIPRHAFSSEEEYGAFFDELSLRAD